jgi:hypothetical protein
MCLMLARFKVTTLIIHCRQRKMQHYSNSVQFASLLFLMAALLNARMQLRLHELQSIIMDCLHHG